MNGIFLSGNYPVFVSEKQWYQIMNQPKQLQDGTLLYLARPTGRIFPPKEFRDRRYYIRVSRRNQPGEQGCESLAGEKLRWRKTDILRIADRKHDTGMEGVEWLQKYDFYVAKIHNIEDWMKKETECEVSEIDPECVYLTDMALSVKAFTYLNHAGIKTLKQIISLPQNRLEFLCKGDAAVIKEIAQAVEMHNVTFIRLP